MHSSITDDSISLPNLDRLDALLVLLLLLVASMLLLPLVLVLMIMLVLMSSLRTMRQNYDGPPQRSLSKNPVLINRYLEGSIDILSRPGEQGRQNVVRNVGFVMRVFDGAGSFTISIRGTRPPTSDRSGEHLTMRLLVAEVGYVEFPSYEVLR